MPSPFFLRLLHGLFNAAVMLLFFYQARLGLTIRHARLSKAAFPLAAVKRHRKIGPVLVVLGGLGFLAGLVLALFLEGKVLQYPLHFFTGLTIVLLLIGTFLISRRIKGPNSPLRKPHFVLGLCVLVLYVVQSFLGLRILI
jgi:uncharacterized membrane protein YozB (DUF420 family)